ncbi:kinase-like protein [Athelia psychrophila]|uniref:Kinase-like protein n=1 Tax=Athelia psychrophila TaxID=1759441 RepID=A0A166K820_9AGAM|nr:kinase-like protein [Fibularhizoctonia sp. CBS 109695]
MSLGVSTVGGTGSGSCNGQPHLDPGGCKNHSIPLEDTVRAAHYTLDQGCENTASLTEALAECLGEHTNVYRHLITDEEAPQITKRIRKYGFPLWISSGSPVTPATNLPLEPDIESESDMEQTEVQKKDPSGDSDWFWVTQCTSEPMDLSGAVVIDRNTSTHGGSYGHVWLGTLKNGKKKIAVAVKAIRLRDDLADYRRKLPNRLERELLVWHGLSHPNIVPLLGTVTNLSSHFSNHFASPAMISPWMKNGNLICYMDSKYLTVSERLHLVGAVIVLDVASGLEYLHSQLGGIVHGDLTGANILIDDQGNALLVDFGRSSIKVQFVPGTSFWTSTTGGAVRWCAPELLPQLPFDEDTKTVPEVTVACDIFSFGCVMLHTMSGMLPYFNIRQSLAVALLICSGKRPKRPDEPILTDECWDIINLCWGESASARPTAKDVHLRVSRLL